jgi:hypothetical protein
MEMNVNINMGVIADILTIATVAIAVIRVIFLEKRVNNLEIQFGNLPTMRGKEAKTIIGDWN